MKNFAVWIVLICTAAVGVAVAQTNNEIASMNQTTMTRYA